MRCIEHAGPIHPLRIDCAAATLRPIDVELPAGMNLLQGLAEVAHAEGAESAVFEIVGGALAPMAFVMPDLSSSPKHVAYFSERHEVMGEAHIDNGCVTLGWRDGAPWFHCHLMWTEADGQQRAGHLLPESCVHDALRLRGWLLDGAGFNVAPDEETNFNLFQVTSGAASSATQPRDDDTEALVIRLKPNEDLCTALEALCSERNVRKARICGGVGSLIGAKFDDGRTVEPFITEVFIQQGCVELDKGGRLRAQIDVGLVTHTGQLAVGRLKRGKNPVLITFELALAIQEVSMVNNTL